MLLTMNLFLKWHLCDLFNMLLWYSQGIATAQKCLDVIVANFLLSRISANKFTELRKTSFPDLHALEKQSNEVSHLGW